MKKVNRKMIKKIIPKCVCHLSSVNFIIDNFLDDCCKLSSDEIRILLWMEIDKKCICSA